MARKSPYVPSDEPENEPESIPVTQRVTNRPVAGIAMDEQADEESRIQYEFVQDILKQFGGENSSVRILRRAANTTNFAYCAKIPIDLFQVDSLAVRYGGGTYRCQVVNALGQYGKSFTIDIDPRIKGEIDQPSTQTQDPLQTMRAFKELTGDNANPFMEMMRSQAERAEKVEAEMRAARVASSDQTTKLILGLASAVAPVFAAMMARPAPPESQLMTILVSKMLDKPDNSEAMLNAFVKLKELTTDGSNDKSTKEEGGMIKEILKLAGPVIAGAMMPQQQPMMKQVSPPMPQQVPTDVPPQQPQVDINQIVNRTYLTIILRAAESKGDVVSMANVIESAIDSQQADQLRGFLNQDNWFELLIAQAPMFEPHREWMTELRNELMVDDEEESAKDSSSST